MWKAVVYYFKTSLQGFIMVMVACCRGLCVCVPDDSFDVWDVCPFIGTLKCFH